MRSMLEIFTYGCVNKLQTPKLFVKFSVTGKRGCPLLIVVSYLLCAMSFDLFVV